MCTIKKNKEKQNKELTVNYRLLHNNNFTRLLRYCLRYSPDDALRIGLIADWLARMNKWRNERKVLGSSSSC